MKLTSHCPTCNKVWVTATSEKWIEGSVVLTSKNCEHIITVDDISDKEIPPFSYADGTKPYSFQLDNIRLFMKGGMKAGCFDEVGLGKTITALGVLRLAQLDPSFFGEKKIFPVAILVKASLRQQWAKEIHEKLGLLAQVVEKDMPPDFTFFNIHIHSMDALRNMEDKEMYPYKTVIIDECHQIKNSESKRTNAVRDLVRGSEFNADAHEEDCASLLMREGDSDDEMFACSCPPKEATNNKNVIVLSGTPIKNNAKEYFVICNLLRPDLFPTEEGFIRTWVHNYWNGRGYTVGGLKNPKLFKEFTQDFFIRHTKDEVALDLPDVVRNFQIRVLEGDFEREYKGILEEYKDYYNKYEEDNFARSSNLLAYMNKMRHLVGLAKTKDAVEFIADFLSSTDRKLVVFHHHQVVGEIISNGAKEVCKILGLDEPMLISTCSPDVRARRIDKFLHDPKSRLLIASTLKSGEGLNLQACSDCLIVERQWNPANEEQAEGRFRRIGSKADKINSTYLIMGGSIDELFTEIVEKKRKLIEEANKGEDIPPTWDESGVMKELQDALAMSGGKKKYNLQKDFITQAKDAIII